MSKDDAKDPKEPTYEDYLERWGRIHYSDKYNDDEWEYRYVQPTLHSASLSRSRGDVLLPESYFDPAEPGVLRILAVKEWRDIGITQSVGWEHYEVHAPEPHILLFRREKDFLEKVRPPISSSLTPSYHTLTSFFSDGWG
ncbi:cyclin-dependent protein kinase CDC28, regulatory subunit CKS1, and related proteins [Moesziomyces antarcticus T-34]|uniref:Cyclin-dependent kinases regulatory subunit n=1 Tax=Pseudozyma antarctica (strain T-34) TaxID=1151754 RepID=M9LXB9_PSEA3|nr:cyclin-dependent protein kinase CDC28, regulatory subunit CKS1, and related proteins [Moesziomyces antarcticus T-34]